MSTSTRFKFPSVIRRQHEGPLGIHIDMYEALWGSTAIHVVRRMCICTSLAISVVG